MKVYDNGMAMALMGRQMTDPWRVKGKFTKEQDEGS